MVLNWTTFLITLVSMIKINMFWIFKLSKTTINKNFSRPPTQNLKFWFSLQRVGVISLWFHYRIKRKNWHQMIWIDKLFILIRCFSIMLDKRYTVEVHNVQNQMFSNFSRNLFFAPLTFLNLASYIQANKIRGSLHF